MSIAFALTLMAVDPSKRQTLATNDAKPIEVAHLCFCLLGRMDRTLNVHWNTIYLTTTSALTMKLHDNITPDLQTWIEKQKVFFVATAPLSGDGHVNLSPKGHDSLRVLDETTVCYLDMTGSGNETSAHIMENGRITFMWCGFEGPPRILRLYGRGETVLRNEHDPRWNELASKFDSLLPGARQIVVNHVDRVQTSCGMAVPFMDYSKETHRITELE